MKGFLFLTGSLCRIRYFASALMRCWCVVSSCRGYTNDEPTTNQRRTNNASTYNDGKKISNCPTTFSITFRLYLIRIQLNTKTLKTRFATIVFLLISITSYAQRPSSKLGIGIDFAFPQSNFGSNANYGVGPSILFQNPINTDLNFTVNVGYLRFNGDAVFSNIKYREGFVPIKVGVRYFFSEYIYGSAEAGTAISTANGNGSGIAFAYNPTLGVEFPVSDKGTIDAGIRYEGWSRSSGTRSFIGLRAGYNF
jgi:hypothetical protein